MGESDEEVRKLYCGNLDSKVTEELLYELFLQAGPLEKVTIPCDRSGASHNYAFIVYKHECSVPYALELFEDTTLFGKLPKLRARRAPNHHRTQSAPANFDQNNMGYDHDPNSQMDFDHLLQMSRELIPRPPGQHQMHMGRPPPMGAPHMGRPPMGGPFMGRPPMGGPYMGMPPMGGPYMGMPPMGGPYMGPPMGGPHMRPPPSMQMQPTPPGDEIPDEGQVDKDDGNRDFSQNALSQSSLQGNWSARNSSHMLPSDDHRRQDSYSRRDRDEGYRGRRGNDYDNYGGHRGGGYHSRFSDGHNSRSPDRRDRRDRNDYRNHGDDRGGYNRSRSDIRDRKGRY